MTALADSLAAARREAQAATELAEDVMAKDPPLLDMTGYASREDVVVLANALYSRANTNHERHRIANRRWYAERGAAMRKAKRGAS